MSDSEAAEYRRRIDEAIDRLSREQNPETRNYWKQLAIENSRLVDLVTMRVGLGLKLGVNLRNVRSVSAVTDLSALEMVPENSLAVSDQ